MAISSVTEVLSDQLFQRPLDIYKEFRHEYFLFSVFPYYDLPKHSRKKRSELRTHGIREITNVAGKILLDSGGFQLYRRKINLDYQDTIKIYRDCRLSPDDHAISLDYCPFFLDSPVIRDDKISRSISNYQEMKKVFPQTIPVIHGTNRSEMKRSLDAMGSNDFLAYPSNFPLIPTMSSQYTKQGVSLKTLLIQRMVTFLSLLRAHRMDDKRIHILGASGQNSSHLAWYAGFDQTDSSSWRIKAAYGKIAFVGVSEAKISKNPSKFGVQQWKNEHDIHLRECRCPVCLGLSLAERKEMLGAPKTAGFNARAIHNAWIYLQERNLARDLIGTLKYRHYLEKRFKGTWWKTFLGKVDESRHQKTLAHFLRT